MTIYMCHKCEVEYGRPQPDCDDELCGQALEDVNDKI